MHDDTTRWDARYEGRRTGAARPPDGVEGIDLPDIGLCVDVACGLGEQSLWAALRGFDVVALDVSPVAIEELRAAAQVAGVSQRIDARVVDLDDGLPSDVTARCALVICQRFRHPALYQHLIDALMPGGLLVVTVLSRVGAAEPGPFHASAGELLSAFDRSELEVLRSVEADGQATLVARRHSA